MSETDEGRPGAGVDHWVRDSLFVWTGIYVPLGDGRYVYSGERPGPGWHGHGYFEKTLVMLVDGEPRKALVLKHRWRLVGTNETCHSRPPDDPVLLRCCTLIVFLKVWAWVSAEAGLHRHAAVFEDLEDVVSLRTVQRWTARATSDAIEIQQAIRLSIIEKSEPRPMESLFEGGLSPPDAVLKRRWKKTADVETLWRAYAMLLVSSKELETSTSRLLAGARKEWPTTKTPFGI